MKSGDWWEPTLPRYAHAGPLASHSGMLLSQPLCSCWYWCVDQTMVQRILSDKGSSLRVLMLDDRAIELCAEGFWRSWRLERAIEQIPTNSRSVIDSKKQAIMMVIIVTRFIPNLYSDSNQLGCRSWRSRPYYRVSFRVPRSPVLL